MRIALIALLFSLFTTLFSPCVSSLAPQSWEVQSFDLAFADDDDDYDDYDDDDDDDDDDYYDDDD